MNTWLYILPIVSSILFWIAVRLGIKMLFHPQQPKKFLGIRFHGLIPSRQQQIAERIGKFASNEFLSFSDIEKKIADPSKLEKIMPMIENHVDDFLRRKLKAEMPMLSMFIGDKTISTLKKVFMQEIESLFPQIMKQMANNFRSGFDTERLITDKLAGFSSDRLEELLFNSMQREFRLAGLYGAVIGFLVGWVQILVIVILS